jgi:NTP pyrophosphatase (non-canonical NTP hydrolase)
MNLETYTDRALETAVYPDVGTGSLSELSYLALGLTGESGETGDCIKKILRSPDDVLVYDEQKEKLALELGDVLWYWVNLCRALGFAPSAILALNIDKLANRANEGTLKSR